MGKTQFCRICRTENNLKYTTKELKQLNKKQLLLAQVAQQGQAENRASKKLLLTTPTLGNICQVCDERIQIFHRLDDGENESSSDVEIDVVTNMNESRPIRFVNSLQHGDVLQRTKRPETPVIVDDDDMLFNIFMQKFNQKTQLQQHQISSQFSQQQLDRQFTDQFHTTYTPPQSTGGGSEGDETKAVEILTSRESSPPAPIQTMAPLMTNPNMVDPQGHRIVAIIELDDMDENEPKNERQSGLYTPVISSSSNLSYTDDFGHRSILLSSGGGNSNLKSSRVLDNCQTVNVEDDEEIIFRKVDIEQEITPALKKRKRKSYDEKELRLVASLNLVSSDSETEELPLKDQNKKIPNAIVTENSKLNLKKSFTCNDCSLTFPDLESLTVHERIHQGVKCTLCNFGFPQVKRLIHHMRHKHREYNGDALSEKPRFGQDSCMTIRLRYMQHTTFYECQLCGRIDNVFKEHKEHIIDKHPNESKSLKDPIMKQLKCPVCKSKCGAQYLSLCRHLITSHEHQEYKNHLRELVHVSAFGWNASRQQEVSKTAKIFQFFKRKTFFFECKICHKVVAGYLHHVRHVKVHQNSTNGETKVKRTALKETVSIKDSSNTTSLSTPHLDKFCNNLKNEDVCLTMKLRKKDDKPKKLTGYSNLNIKSKPTRKLINITTKQKPSENSVTSKLRNKHMGKVENPTRNFRSKKSEVEVKNDSRKKIRIKNKLKPKEKVLEKLPNSTKLTKGKPKKERSKTENKKLREKSTRVKDIELRPQVIKVKVKAPIRQIDLQKYKCKYCLKQFKGFRLYNLHLLREHKENEYCKCNKCNKLYTKFSNLEQHIKQCLQVLSTSKQKRKFSEPASLPVNLTESSESYVENVPNKSDVNPTYLEDNYLWLKDLLKLKKPLEIRDSSPNFHESPKTALFRENTIISQCCYCLHLFASDKDLMEHKKNIHLENSDILIRYKPFKNP